MANTPAQSTPQASNMNLPTFPDALTTSTPDTLPLLSAILSRLQLPSTTTIPQPSSTPATLSSNATGALTIKDIPTATDDIKHKLQKARVAVKEFPDIERTIAEQEEEMRQLEEKIVRQRQVLDSLRNGGVEAMREKEGRMES